MDLGLLHIQDEALCDNNERLSAVNYYHKELHLGCCNSPRSASENKLMFMILFGIHCTTKKVVDLDVFSFLQGKMCGPEKSGASQRFLGQTPTHQSYDTLITWSYEGM